MNKPILVKHKITAKPLKIVSFNPYTFHYFIYIKHKSYTHYNKPLDVLYTNSYIIK